MPEHYCKNCKNSNGNNTCKFTGATHTTGIECPSFRQKEVEMSNETNRIGDEPERLFTPPIRTFDSGATRDTDQGKLDYIKALSPIVLRRYVQYLDKHRLQSDGSYRDFDNWKQGMPEEVYISGGGRHFVDTWLLTEGYATEDNHGPVEIEDAICAQLFNLMGRLHEMLKEEINYQAAVDHETGDDHTAPTEGGY